MLGHQPRGSRPRRRRSRARRRARSSARSESRRSRSSVERVRAGDRPRAASSSNSFSPRASVSAKRSSSARSDVARSARACSASSGYHGAICSTTTSEIRHRSSQPDRPRLLDRAPDDPAEDVAAALVRRGDAVADEEGHPAAVVGEDAVRLRRGLRLAEGDAALGGDPGHDRLVAVRLVDRAVRHVLDDRREPLEPHPGVDVLLRQRGQRRRRRCCSYSMKTRFQNSRKRSQRGQPGAQSGSPQPCSAPRSQ